MPKWNIDPKFRIAANASIIRFLDEVSPSAHSDVASELINAVRNFDGASWYCPDIPKYAFVVVHTSENVIFGIAYGMTAYAIRIDQIDIEAALAEGAKRLPELGNDWVHFNPFDVNVSLDVSRQKLRKWTSKAFAKFNVRN
jgi:hypothetical protein